MQSAISRMNYKNEFPDYDDTLPTLEGFEDCSWKNDVCPSLCETGKEPDDAIFIFCDYKNPELRENGANQPRFVVLKGYGNYPCLFETNDWLEVENFIKSYKGAVVSYTKEQIDQIVEDALNALCLSVQNAVGQTDGGFASIYFSGDEFREHIKDYVKGEIGEVNFLKEQS